MLANAPGEGGPTMVESARLLADPDVAWHALRGYDFAGLEAILREGLRPADNQGETVVCLSMSPSRSRAAGLEANSFETYSLGEGLTLAIRGMANLYPLRDHGGFVDEVRVPGVEAERIGAIMVSEAGLETPLDIASTEHGPRKPLQMLAYLDRTIAHIESLGGSVSAETAAAIRDAADVSRRGATVAKADSARLQAGFMAAYARIAGTTDVPTVGDMIAVVLERAGRNVPVATRSEDQKADVSAANAELGRKTFAADGYGMTAGGSMARGLGFPTQPVLDHAPRLTATQVVKRLCGLLRGGSDSSRAMNV